MRTYRRDVKEVITDQECDECAFEMWLLKNGNYICPNETCELFEEEYELVDNDE